MSFYESGDVATGVSLWPLPAQLGWPSGQSTLSSVLSHPFTQIPTSLSPQGFIFAEESSFLFPSTPTMHCKILGRGLGCLEGLGSHWLDCCFLIGL